MQVVHLHWGTSSMQGTGFDDLLIPCSHLEVVAHLDVSEAGVRQLMRCQFRDGYGPEDLSDSKHLTFESALPSREGEPPIVVFNTHPLALASIQFQDIAVLPPYTISEEGISITLRGVPSGIAAFLKLAREILPPDKVKVVKEEQETNGLKNQFGERQWEVVQAAVQWGYYDNPRRISIRQMSERLDIARSTLGEHLHGAESILVRWVVEND